MTNATIIILAHIDATEDSVIPGTGWTHAQALSAAAGRMLDETRFGVNDPLADILAFHGEETRVPLYPSADEMEQGGVDLVALNNAFANGLDSGVFGQAVNAGLALADVNDLLERYSADDLTGMLANFVEAHAEAAACPNANERAFRRAVRRAA